MKILHHKFLWQIKCAGWLQQKGERLSRKGKIRAMLLFCLLAGGYSLYLVTTGFSGQPILSVPVSPIKQPAYSLQWGDEHIKPASAHISKEAYQKVQRFRRYIDSLDRSPSGQVIRDSILRYRPGLMDSIAFFEKEYPTQTK